VERALKLIAGLLFLENLPYYKVAITEQLH